MHVLQNLIEFLFSSALFANALLFVPQALKIFKQKESRDVSLITFLGFFLIQFLVVLHGIVVKDWLLSIGYIFSMVTCGSVILLTFIYKNPRQH